MVLAWPPSAPRGLGIVVMGRCRFGVYVTCKWFSASPQLHRAVPSRMFEEHTSEAHQCLAHLLLLLVCVCLLSPCVVWLEPLLVSVPICVPLSWECLDVLHDGFGDMCKKKTMSKRLSRTSWHLLLMRFGLVWVLLLPRSCWYGLCRC